ncbi:MAG: hypothetical protein KC912_25620 [Proteobacteria bacterium]|nr:hypothetical protein [Pseudomonadota bacterium]
MRLAALTVTVALLLGCEHNEHPFEVPWSVNCAAPDAPPMGAFFDRDFWQDDNYNRRRYTGEMRVHMDLELYDSWMWAIEVNLADETAETLTLEQSPIPDSFVQAYDLQPLGLTLDTYVEDIDEEWAEMTGTCSWGDSTGEMSMRQQDDCDACIDCSTVGGSPRLLWPLVPLTLLLTRRRRVRQTATGFERL